MSASYFNKRGAGHSIRGTIAREQGGMAWSRLPASLRRGLASVQAQDLGISTEWHHAGKYANEVYVYYPDQVKAFWDSLDGAGETAEALLSCGSLPLEVLQARTAAQKAAEQVRCEIVDEEYVAW